MKSLIPIDETGEQIRRLCVPGISDNTRKGRILADQLSIEREEAQFREAIAHHAVRALEPGPFTDQVKDDMVWLYEERLRSSAPGRQIYLKILGLSKGGCPLCHVAKVKTLDHSMPKAVHPRLAVDPLNLVPTCRDCNLSRNAGTGSVSISPYFDDWVETVPWLVAEVPDIANPSDLHFRIARDPVYSDDRWDALEEFFQESDIAARYADLAIDEYFALAAEIRLRFERLAVDDVRMVLEERCQGSESSRGHNRWQTAAYRAWLAVAGGIDWAES